MRPETSKYVWDATEAARCVLRFTRGKTLDDYVNDDLLRAAVERQFTILGEALSHVRRIEPEVAERIADLPRAVALRNILVHGYADVDDRIIWGVVIGPLPAMLTALEAL
jgi:uncharacterized protein with HEPN domain